MTSDRSMLAAHGARYDGVAAWYDESAAPAPESLVAVADLLGPGSGICIDLGCGTGHYFDVIRASGRWVVGVDISAGQLARARTRGQPLVRADATALPFADRVASTVSAIWVSTDVDDLRFVMREARRVLAADGTFLFFGVHPCFNGPAVESRQDGARIVHPTYRKAGWHEASPWWGDACIRRRVGMRHVPLSDLFNAVVDAGLRIVRVVEPRSEPVPSVLSVIAKRD